MPFDCVLRGASGENAHIFARFTEKFKYFGNSKPFFQLNRNNDNFVSTILMNEIR